MAAKSGSLARAPKHKSCWKQKKIKYLLSLLIRFRRHSVFLKIRCTPTVICTCNIYNHNLIHVTLIMGLLWAVASPVQVLKTTNTVSYSLRLNNMQQQHKRSDKQSNVELNVVLNVLPLPPSFESQLRMLSTKSVSN